MSNFNIWGQITLMIRNIEARKTHLKALSGTILESISDLETATDILREEKQKLEKIGEYYRKVEADLADKRAEQQSLDDEVTTLRTQPGIEAILKGKISQSKRTKHGSQQPSSSRTSPSVMIGDQSVQTQIPLRGSILGKPRRRYADIEESDDDDFINDVSLRNRILRKDIIAGDKNPAKDTVEDGALQDVDMLENEGVDGRGDEDFQMGEVLS
jgi:hypothetical protein